MEGLLWRSLACGSVRKVADCWPGGGIKDRIRFAERTTFPIDGKVNMNLDYAVDRLYEAGWIPSGDSAVERLADGRWYPSMSAVVREFAAAGLQLSVKHNLMFSCYRATWAPIGEGLDVDHV